MAHLGWMYAGVHAKNAPKRPPKPIRRPGDESSTPGVTITRNLTERIEVTAGSLSIAELDAVIAEQTGTARGIEVD